MLADEYFRSKKSVPSEMRTAQWELVGQWEKEGVFYSAGVAEAEILDEFRREAQKVVEGSTDESTARKNLQLFLDRIGYQPEAGQEGTIKDLRSLRRLTVMLRTNRQLAQGYAQKIRGMGPGAIRLYPAWELVRMGPMPQSPREWQKRFVMAGGKLTADGRMIALKDDKVWSVLGNKDEFTDALGVDYPPFAWQSGMGWMEVKHKAAKDLGLLDGWKPPAPQPLSSPNESLQVKPRIESPVIREALSQKLKGFAEWDGDVLRFTDPNGTRKMDQREAARVITANLPDGFPNLQAEAARLWLGNAAKNIKSKQGKDVLDDFTRLLRRLEPLEGNTPVFRGEYYASESDLLKRINMFVDGYAVTRMGESFTLLERIAQKFATGKTPYELILVCKRHGSLKPVYEIAKRVLPKYAKQGEVIAMEGTRFRAVNEPYTMIDIKGRKQIYLEVEEVGP
jgi:hypothetical protein